MDESLHFIQKMNVIRDEILAKVALPNHQQPRQEFRMIDQGLTDLVVEVLAKLDCNSVRVATDAALLDLRGQNAEA